MLLGKAVMINWSYVAPEHRAADLRMAQPRAHGRAGRDHGFQRGRRYIAVDAQRDFFNSYEVDDLAVRDRGRLSRQANAPSPLTQRTTPFVKNSRARDLAQ